MEDWGHAPREREGRHVGGRRRRDDAGKDHDDLDNPKNGRRGEGNDEIGDELQFAYRQCATRCIERARHQALLPSDRLFGIFTLYLANRNDKFVKRLVASPLRLDYVSPVGLLTSTQYTKEDALDLEKVLSDLERAAVASVGDGPALATSDTPESFWAKCHRLVSALERARDAEEEASRAATYTSPTAKGAKEEIEDMVLALLSKYDNLPKAAAELKALARCDVPGVDKSFYATAATMAEVLLAKRLLEAYEERYFVDEELPPPPSQRSTNADAGMSEAECAVLMDETGDALEGEQQLFMDEIVTYGREHLPTWLKPDQAIEMKKPERFAKVMAGFKWNKYNRAHFNSSTNPPPKTVTAYEFTLLYPNLAQNKLPYFEVLPTEKGWDDEYCIIVFRAGPPYLDVAYRIVNKQWDKGRGVKSTFDSNGKFKLYFRFTSTSYRR